MVRNRAIKLNTHTKDKLTSIMGIKEHYSFQVDSEIVKRFFQDEDNYRIEYSDNGLKDYCIIYFSSNDIYYPNTEIAFKEQFVEKKSFEWYKTRIKIGHKHIFIRDIQKQWYLGGINSSLNSPEKLLAFLKKETNSYHVITIGSSAGGFAAITYGQLLNAEKTFSFNGNFELQSKIKSTTEVHAPLVFRNMRNKEFEKWFDARNLISNPSAIFYFQSIKSPKDLLQYNHVRDIPINIIRFNTSNHGVPFLKSNLPIVINSEPSVLLQMTGQVLHPITFSIRTVGVFKTIQAFSTILRFGIKKIYIHTIQRLK